jgi:hypothetical protein
MDVFKVLVGLVLVALLLFAASSKTRDSAQYFKPATPFQSDDDSTTGADTPTTSPGIAQPVRTAEQLSALQRRTKVSADDRLAAGSSSKLLDTTNFVVFTTVNPPTAQARDLCAMANWNVVVVADTKTPTAAWSAGVGNCIFLSMETQRALGYEIHDLLPIKRYERKNIGYLFAIQHGAQLILDTDDDNIQASPMPLVFPERVCAARAAESRPVWNPYIHFGHPELWRRGYPFEYIQPQGTKDDAGAYTRSCEVRAPIQQGLADFDPDLDAVQRLMKPLQQTRHVVFDRDASVLALPQGVMAPVNSQNTIFYHSAFWGLLLPITTRWREDDIWRGFWMQRMLWEIDAEMLYTTATAFQIRNPHDYVWDMGQELDMYMLSGKFVRFLRSWKSTDTEFFPVLAALLRAIHDGGFVKFEDFELGMAWIRDLQRVGYVPPPISRAQRNASTTCTPCTPAVLPTKYRSLMKAQDLDAVAAQFDQVEGGQGDGRFTPTAGSVTVSTSKKENKPKSSSTTDSTNSKENVNKTAAGFEAIFNRLPADWQDKLRTDVWFPPSPQCIEKGLIEHVGKESRGSVATQKLSSGYEFVHVPKTGGETMEKLLKVGKDHSDMNYRLQNGRAKARNFAFAYTRNPFSRIVSLFHYLKATRKAGVRTAHNSGLPGMIPVEDFDDWVPHVIFNNLKMGLLDGPMTFRPPCSVYEFYPTASWLVDEQCKVLVDYVARLEDFRDETEYLHRLVLKRNLARLPHENKSKHDHYSTYFTNSSIVDLVRYAYAADFVLFGYSLDP